MVRDLARRWTRRQFLADMGVGAAALAASNAFPATLRVPRDQLMELAVLLRDTPRDKVFDVTADLARAGTDWRTVLGGLFLAGILDVRPRGVGGKLHCVLVVESMFQLGETLPAAEQWRLVLWNVQHFKSSQAESLSQGNWHLQPSVPQKAPSAEQGRAEFLAAMAAYDDARADRAVTALIPHCDHQSFFEILWPVGARYHFNIGHKAIYMAQAERVLRRIGWQHAEPVLRSLVHALLYTGQGGPGKDCIELSEANAPKLPKSWREGRDEPRRSAELLQGLRGKTPEQRQELVIAALKDGLGVQTIWDAMRLCGSEVVLRRRSSDPGNRGALLPVHALTVMSAGRHMWSQTRNEPTQRLLLLQTAGWLSFSESDLYAPVEGETARCIDQLAPAREVTGLAALYEDPTPANAQGLLARHPKLQAELEQRLRSTLARAPFESHQHKYLAAAIEESRLANPAWAAHVLAPTVPYVPVNAPAKQGEFAERAERALTRAGLS